VVEHRARHRVLRPILCFIGGKSRLARLLMRVGGAFPPHRIYVEPFFGGGSIFFAKPLAEVNVINDVDEQLMSFYRKFRQLPILECDMTPDRERWERLREQLKLRQPLEPCDYLYLNKMSWNCRMEAFSPKRAARCRGPPEKQKTCMIRTLLRDFSLYREKLAAATIHSEDYRRILDRYDSPETFFFLDPPYFAEKLRGTRECLYRMYGGCEVDPEEVYEAVRKLRGKFMLTYPNLPEIRELFGEFNQATVGWRYTALVGAGRKPFVEELIITNYEWPSHRARHIARSRVRGGSPRG